VTIRQAGVFRLRTEVAALSLEASGLVLRVVKDGDGRALVDELFLGKKEPRP